MKRLAVKLLRRLIVQRATQGASASGKYEEGLHYSGESARIIMKTSWCCCIGSLIVEAQRLLRTGLWSIRVLRHSIVTVTQLSSRCNLQKRRSVTGGGITDVLCLDGYARESNICRLCTGEWHNCTRFHTR